jgi:O-antigen/teichoic acid export membrane protein
MNLSSRTPFWATARRIVWRRIFRKESRMENFALTPLISLIAGVIILIMPRLLNYIVAIYLIVVGLIGLFPDMMG